jgi:HSP20 family molecular chaperone IbpA
MNTTTTTTDNAITRSDRREIAETTDALRPVTPAVDIFESPKELLVVADVPGAGKDDVSIRFEKDRLTIEAKTPRIRYHREFVVAAGVDVDAAEAKVQHGVLTLKLPKAKALQVRQIKVLNG